VNAKDRRNQEKCPFWSATSKKCSICEGGLFIPLDDHVEAFCKTPRFSACPIYVDHSENQLVLLEKVRKSELNRRKYMRFETSRHLTLIKIFASGKLVSQLASDVKTIDISKGGVRMATEQPLDNDTVVQISFDDATSQTLHEITGHIKWCNKQPDEPGYQTGVSFPEERIVEAMGHYLEQYHDLG
jgi:hypothetical protein